VRNAIRMDSMAKGRSAVKELADATAVAVIRPVHRPTSLASVFVGIYPILFSSKNLYPVVRLPSFSSGVQDAHSPKNVSKLG
jgi:hypothetical protein